MVTTGNAAESAKILPPKIIMATSSETGTPAANISDSLSFQEHSSGGDSEVQESTKPECLPGYLHWEDDLEMVSKYLDRKVRVCVCV